MNKKKSFTTILFIYLVLPIFLIAIIVGTGVYLEIKTNLVNNEQENTLQIVVNESNYIESEINSAKKHIKNIANNENLIKNIEAGTTHDYLKNSNLSEEFDFISIFDKNGTIIHSDQSTDEELETKQETNNFAFRNYVKMALNGQEGFDIAVGRDTNQLGIFISFPIYSKNKELIGGMVGKFNIQQIQSQVHQNFQNKFDEFYITDELGVIVYSKDESKYLQTINKLNKQTEKKLKVDEKKYINLKSESLNDNVTLSKIIQYKEPVSNFIEVGDQNILNDIVKIEDYPIFLVTKKNPKDLQSEINKASLKIIVLFSLALISVILILFLIIKKTTKPLKNIIEAISEIKEGNYNFRLQKQSEDETSVLVEVFNSMVDKMNQKRILQESEIKEQNTQLEEQTKALVNVLEDVQNEKNKALTALLELKKFQLAVENSSDLITITDKEGMVVYVNNSVENMTGFTVEETLGRKAGTLWGKLMSDDFYNDLWNTIKLEKKTFKAKIDNHKKNGEKFVAEITITPLLDDSRDIQFFVSVQRDINKEEQIEKIKNEFISIASHQLRTPLSAIKWYLEMLKDQNSENKNDEPEIINNIEQSNERMITLVNSLLNISRIESGRMEIKPQITKLDELVNDVKEEFEIMAKEKNIKIDLQLDSKLQAISIDPKLIREVYKNLVSNAIKYSNPNTHIKIEVFKKDNFIESTIVDQGYGIPVEEKKKIFEKFYRAKNVVKLDVEGNGLGLYLTKAIVEASGGQIWFESTIGTGTTFFFTLPLSGSPQNQGQVSLDPEPIK